VLREYGMEDSWYGLIRTVAANDGDQACGVLSEGSVRDCVARAARDRCHRFFQVFCSQLIWRWKQDSFGAEKGLRSLNRVCTVVVCDVAARYHERVSELSPVLILFGAGRYSSLPTVEVELSTWVVHSNIGGFFE